MLFQWTILIISQTNFTNSLALPMYSKSLYIIDVLINSDTNMGNSTQFKQILIDLDNYNTLKELGKAGDSFNKVIGSLLNRFKIEGGKL